MWKEKDKKGVCIEVGPMEAQILFYPHRFLKTDVVNTMLTSFFYKNKSILLVIS